MSNMNGDCDECGCQSSPSEAQMRERALTLAVEVSVEGEDHNKTVGRAMRYYGFLETGA